MNPPVRLETPRRRRLRRGVVGLLLFELVYVLAFEVAARSGRLERWINRRPEKIVISFEAAHSFLPFWVVARGLELHGQTPALRWRLAVDQAQALLSPFGLLRRTLRFPWATAAGGELQLRRETGGDLQGESPDAGALEARLPALEPLAQPAVARPPSSRPKWSFELPNVAANGLREVWLDGIRLAGSFAARGDVAMYAGSELEVGPSRLELSDVSVLIGAAEIGRALAGSVEVRVGRYPFKEEQGLAALRFVSGSVDVRGELAERELLGLFLAQAPWLTVGESLGALTARVEVENGKLRPGTKVEFRHPDLETRAFDFRATGDARVDFVVGESAGEESGARVTLEVRYDDFEVRSGAATQPEFVGTGLTLVATTPDLELASVTNAARIRIDLGHARIPDLSVYDSWMPPSSGLTLLGGGGALSGTFDADLAANDAQGRFTATIEAAAVRYQDLDLTGGVVVDVRIPSADLARRKFDLSATRVELRDFHSPQAAAAGPGAAEAGWWARFELPEGRLTLPPEAAATARFDVTLRDSVPLVGLFQTRKALPRWIERLLTIEDIRATGELAWSPTGLTLEDVSTRFRSATIRARLRFAPDSKRGVLMVEWRRLALGLRVDDERKKFKLVGVRRWFESADLGAPTGTEPDDDPLSQEALRSVELPGVNATVELGEGPAPASASGADGASGEGELEVVAGGTTRADLDGDPELEAVALLAVPTASAPRALHVVALDLVDGRATSLGARELPPGSQVRALGVEAEAIVAQLLVPGEGDEACCPSRKRTVRWRPRQEELEQLDSSENGPFALADLAGSRWRIVAGATEPGMAPPAAEVEFSESTIFVGAGCSRVGASASSSPGLVLTIGSFASSPSDCADGKASPPATAPPEAPAMIELEGSWRLAFSPGRLSLARIGDSGRSGWALEQVAVVVPAE